MPWYKLTISKEDISKRVDLCLEREFNALLEELEANRCLGMYRDTQSESTFFIGCDTACQLLHGLIQFYKGELCSRPSFEHLLEVAGHFDDHQVEQIT